MRGKLVSWKNIDQYREFSNTYKKEASAYKDAADAIKEWAQIELNELTGEDLDEEGQESLEHLQNAVTFIAEGKNKEAYEEWREFADWRDPREDVMIEDTEIFEE